jgi:hypothetical protein
MHFMSVTFRTDVKGRLLGVSYGESGEKKDISSYSG